MEQTNAVTRIRKHIQDEHGPFPFPEKSYLVLMTPRTGSNLLTAYLQSIGAGYPIEAFHFNHANIQDLYGWDEQDFKTPAAHLKKAIEFQTVGDVFGMKLNWLQYQDFLKSVRQLTDPIDPSLSDREAIEAFLPDPAFIYMRRRGKIKQAVSFSKGMQTGIWMERVGESQEYKKYVLPPVYDRELIEGCLEILMGYDLLWLAYLRQNQIDYLNLWYENLAQDFPRWAGEVNRYLGIDQEELPEPLLKKQANPQSQEWVARFTAETPWVDDKEMKAAGKTGDFSTIFLQRSWTLLHQKVDNRYKSMPSIRFKPLRRFVLNVKRKLSSFF